MRRILTYIMLVSALSVNALHQVYAAAAVDARTEAPVAGTVVRLGEDYLWAVTGEDGSFVFRTVQAGRYVVEASCDRHHSLPVSGFCFLSRRIKKVKTDLTGG